MHVDKNYESQEMNDHNLYINHFIVLLCLICRIQKMDFICYLVDNQINPPIVSLGEIKIIHWLKWLFQVILADCRMFRFLKNLTMVCGMSFIQKSILMFIYIKKKILL